MYDIVNEVQNRYTNGVILAMIIHKRDEKRMGIESIYTSICYCSLWVSFGSATKVQKTKRNKSNFYFYNNICPTFDITNIDQRLSIYLSIKKTNTFFDRNI